MRNDDFSIGGVEFYGEWKAAKIPRRLPRHKNPGLEIVLVSKGELKWEVENKEIELRANSLFYTLPWQEHGGVEEMQPSCEISYLCLRLAKNHPKPRRRFQFHRAFGFMPVEERAISSALTGCRTQAIPANSEIVWLVAHFFKITRETMPLRHGRARDTIKLLLSCLAAAIATPHHSTPRMAEAERRLRTFTDILNRRYTEPWTLQSMSAACRLGRTQFSLLLKKHTGDTPVIYLNRIRVREAKRVLCQSNKSITETALAVGFNSSQYFATVFKEFTDMDSRSFRAQAAARRERRARSCGGNSATVI
jgi:AraC-like DNA-binding protein